MRETAQAIVAKPAVQAGTLVLAALLLRVATFGDPNIYIDESFYLLVGHEMHFGAVPYVDIWDRKPLGLFLAYWLFAAFGNGVLAYQLAAWLSAAATAWLICRIACRSMPPAGALMAGLLYLATIGALLGLGGQGPVFYNTLVAGAALLVLRYREDGVRWRLHAAMLLLGIAITFKQPVVFEAIFLGAFAAWHHRDGRLAAMQIALGALPTAVIAAWYVEMGFWPQFYHAMVTADLVRPRVPTAAVLHNGWNLLRILGLLLAAAIYSILFAKPGPDRRFLCLWLVAAMAGFLSVPLLVDHYALPVLVPLSIMAGASFAHRPAGTLIGLLALAYGIVLTGPQHFDRHIRSRGEFDRMVATIGPLRPNQGLLVYDGPPLLYAAAGTHPMSPLAFPGHLWNKYEKDVSPFKSGDELRRIVARRPVAVVMRERPDPPPDPEAFGELEAYVGAHCRPPVRAQIYYPSGKAEAHLVYAGCAPAGAATDR